MGYSDTFGGYDGGQAEYLRVPYANVGPTIIPEGLEDEQVLFLTDILPTSYWGVEMSCMKKGDTVVVLGCGPVGLLSIKWAIFKGAKRVIAVDCVDYRLNHAKSYKGVETVNLEDYDDTGEYLKELTNGGADVVIECPAQAYVNPILKLIQEGKFDARDIITHKISLSDGEHAYDIFDNKKDNCIKVILKP